MTQVYEDTVKLLTSVGKFRISLGLERISAILALLGNPQDNLKCIHVAGTNGKGSVCAILASILGSAGMNVGLFTSPHIFKYTERIKINGQEISEEDFCRYVFEIAELADKKGIDLTEFEILTAVMFKYFSDKCVDVVVLETGLGGRYDATNVIKSNLCSIITHVDLDHTDRLGSTRDEIASEKAGIIKPDCPCIVFEGFEVYKDTADKLNAPLILINPLENPQNLALKGIYQQENLSLAIAGIREVFKTVSKSVIEEGLRNVRHICRFQYIEDKNIIIDGAHNPNGIEALRQSLDYYYPNYSRRFIFGCLNTKDYPKMIEKLFNSCDEIYFYHFGHQNSCEVVELQSVCPYPSEEFTQDTNIDFWDGKLNIMCGSFYMIAELTQMLGINCNK